MRLPRTSIAGLMAAVAIAAFALAVLHEDLTNVAFYRHGHELAVGVLPMACLLVWGLLVGVGGLLRRGECHPFLVGFEVFGWAALFLFVSCGAVASQIGEHPIWLIEPLAQHFFRTDPLRYRDTHILLFHVTVFFVPSFAAALIGGWLSQALDVRLVRRRRWEAVTRRDEKP